METAVATAEKTPKNGQALVQKSIWDSQITEIRNAFAPELNDTQFTMFVELGRSLQLNPFKREIWAVKYKDQVSVFVGRDGYRKVAQEQADYNGHLVEAVYSNDRIKVSNGHLEHEFNLFERGHLTGAYCEVYRRGIDVPFRVMVRLDEYKKNFGNWQSMPETMIKKVAESQALRQAYQGLLGGTYHDAEDWRKPDQDYQSGEFDKMRSHGQNSATKAQSDTTSASKSNSGTSGRSRPKMTDKQRELLAKITNSSHLTKPEKKERQSFLDDPESLKADASTLIDDTMKLIDERKAAENTEDAEFEETEQPPIQDAASENAREAIKAFLDEEYLSEKEKLNLEGYADDERLTNKSAQTLISSAAQRINARKEQSEKLVTGVRNHWSWESDEKAIEWLDRKNAGWRLLNSEDSSALLTSVLEDQELPF